MRVLIAEDDANIRKGLAQILDDEGYETLSAEDGETALTLFHAERPDFVCLDVMMPGLDGFEVCRRIRAVSQRVPIIFISAKSEEVDKVLGLEIGADDYILKPFGVKEVVARVRAVTRRCIADRSTEHRTSRFSLGDLEVAPDELRARRGETTIDLSLREVRILSVLAREAGRVVDRQMLFSECWGLDHVPLGRALDQQILQLRKKIERDPANPTIIRTVHGAGYRYEP